MISADMSGKRVLITGGGSGIGLAASRLFAHCGAKVAANILPGDEAAVARLADLAGQGLEIITVPGDIGVAAQADAMVGTAIATLDGLDVLVNNAGTTNTREPIDFADLDAMTEEFWDKVMAVNLLGAFRCAKAAATALKASSGSIVNTASIAGLGVRGSSIAYAASKAGLISLTRSLARALAPKVRVNAVAPGFIETPLTQAWSKARKQSTLDRTLLGRLGQAEDIAEAMLFLAAGASYMTGQTVVLDGGAA